jgi:hypothetical protein
MLYMRLDCICVITITFPLSQSVIRKNDLLNRICTSSQTVDVHVCVPPSRATAGEHHLLVQREELPQVHGCGK